MAARASSPGEMTIDALAQKMDVPVRTLREYQSMRLLPPPERRGRIGLYDERHVQRLELIARLQRRGYSLAGIRDLLGAWDAGSDLTTLLGVGRSPVAADETPLRLSKAELAEQVPGLQGSALQQAVTAGLVSPESPGYVVVRSPALLGLVVEGVRVGVALREMLELIALLVLEVDGLAQAIASSVIERVWEPVVQGDQADQLGVLLQRGRLLLIQGVASVLADRMAPALLAGSKDAEGGVALREALESVRVGVYADSRGQIHRRNGPEPPRTPSEETT